MNRTSARRRTVARFLRGMVAASAIGLGTVASAGAAPAPARHNLPAIQGPSGVPRGVTLERARAEARALGRPVRDAASGSLLASAPTGITALFIAPLGQLAVIGTTQNDTITVSRNAAGGLLVNGGAVRILGPTATVANTSLIDVFGLEGDDALALDEANGTLPNADLFGGAGNDTLIGGSGADQLFGASGDDTLLSKGGNDFLGGGSGNDVLTGGAGDDQAFGESSDDRIIWNPGDGTDLNEGGDGSDTIEVNGGNGTEAFSATPNGARVRFDRLSPAPFSLDIGTAENLVLNMNGGDDTFTGSNGLRGLIQLTVDGGPGNDTIVGGDGDDVLIGGDGNDTITGGRGNDTAMLGDGDDVFIWNPGDGSDTVEGQSGSDTLTFNGANVAETMDFSTNGPRVRFTRDVGPIAMDLNGIETVNLNTLGGADQTTVNGLTGTDLTQVNVDLASSQGGGDNAVDTVIVNATNANDAILLSGSAGAAAVDGLKPRVTVTNAEVTDVLAINALGGDDAIQGSGVSAGSIALKVSGGDGDDVLIGGAGNDQLFGDAGDDLLFGGPGTDLLDGGTGNNVLVQD
jgi:Ca2+-binding RTX toxin-like protein